MKNLLKGIYVRNRVKQLKRKCGFFADSAYVSRDARIVGYKNIYIYENSHIGKGAIIQAGSAKFIVKKYCGIASNLVVSTGTHVTPIGKWLKSISEEEKIKIDPTNSSSGDVVLEEDVWLATGVILLPGVTIGRGSIVGAGSVVRRSVPPYSRVIGNPAKIVGFRFTPNQIIEHEKQLYNEDERLQLEVLEKNYKKYFLDKRTEILSYINL